MGEKLNVYEMEREIQRMRAEREHAERCARVEAEYHIERLRHEAWRSERATTPRPARKGRKGRK